jgi:hypothetical protein
LTFSPHLRQWPGFHHTQRSHRLRRCRNPRRPARSSVNQQSQETSEVLTHAQGGRHSLLTECRPSHDHGAQALSTAPSLGGSRPTTRKRSQAPGEPRQARRRVGCRRSSKRSKINCSEQSKRAGPSCRRCIKLGPAALGQSPQAVFNENRSPGQLDQGWAGALDFAGTEQRTTLRIVHFGENPARQTLTQFNPHVVRAS